MPLIDHFGLLAPFYEKFITPSVSDTLVALLNIEDGLNLLDAGGGTGRVSELLTSRFREITLADESHKMLSQASQKRLRLIQSHAEILPFPTNSFDRIIMIDALHHVIDQQDTALELLRVLAPGGRMIIEEPNFEHIAVKITAALERLALMRSRFLRPVEIAGLFTGQPVRTDIVRDGYTSWIVVDKPG